MRDKWLKRGNVAATVSEKVGFVRLLLTVARNRGLIESNHAEGMELKPDTRAVELRQPFTPDQVRRILAATDGLRNEHPARYWIPRLGCLTGARLNELAQRRTQDIVSKDGFAGLLLTDQVEYLQEYQWH